MSNVYEATVYSREVTYKNLKGDEKTTTLYFALDPITLLQIISAVKPKASRSGNPANRGKVEFEEGYEIELVRTLCIKAAGEPSEDGEVWIPFTDFDESIVGKGFLTQLTASDGDRKEFAEKVILDPIRAFVGYAQADESNSPKDVQQFATVLAQLERVFAPGEDKPEESLADKKARLAAELASIGEGDESGE